MRSQATAPVLGTISVMVIVMIVGALLGAWLWPYTINAWLEFFGKAPRIEWWQGALIGFLPYFGYVTIPAAVMTWLLMLFLL